MINIITLKQMIHTNSKHLVNKKISKHLRIFYKMLITLILMYLKLEFDLHTANAEYDGVQNRETETKIRNNEIRRHTVNCLRPEIKNKHRYENSNVPNQPSI